MTCCSHQPAPPFGIARVVPKDKLVHLLGNINKECRLIGHFIKFTYVFTSGILIVDAFDLRGRGRWGTRLSIHDFKLVCVVFDQWKWGRTTHEGGMKEMVLDLEEEEGMGGDGPGP